MSKNRLLYFLLFLLTFSCRSQNSSTSNHLAGESSPYLLQHAHNPVDWYPWGPEALEKAKRENKLLIISVGYSACHWCHVMEKESFSDTAVANLMNRHFINIKVDREERPDIDNVYMSACQLTSEGGCGWPLNAFALPDGRPLYAGTYFPKEEWLQIVQNFVDMKQNEYEKLVGFANNLTSDLQRGDKAFLNPTGHKAENHADLDKIFENFTTKIDRENGGRQGAPKFPMPNNWDFLLRYHYMTQNTEALKAVTLTLDRMAMGGLYDHLGGGFARYSTDEEWKVPHFEKMLYDNAQLVSLYTQAWQVTKNPLYEKVVRESLDFIKNDMTSPDGAFYSSLDADTEGEEGRFYVWKKTEIDAVLTDPKENQVFCDYFEITPKGNWEKQLNVVWRKKSAAEVARNSKLTEVEVEKIIAAAKAKLLHVRNKRPRPSLDNKINTAWNALMLKGYVDAYRAFGDEVYLKTALKNADFLTARMLQPDKRLLHNFKDGKATINGFLEDYAFAAQAFTSLYQATFDEKWLYLAKDFCDYAIAHFYDSDSKMFFFTSDLDPVLVSRKLEITDNVIPGSNSVIARNLYHLADLFDQKDYRTKAEAMLANLTHTLSSTDTPNFYSNWCQLYAEMVTPPYEVAIVGEDFSEKRAALQASYLPTCLFLGGKDEGSLELLKEKLRPGETLIYVCQNKVCKLPVAEPERALGMIR